MVSISATDDECPVVISFVFVISGLLLGGLSHILADMIATASFEQPVEPFWPFFTKPISIYLIQHYSAPIWNGGLLVVTLAIHLGLYLLNPAPIRHSR